MNQPRRIFQPYETVKVNADLKTNPPIPAGSEVEVEGYWDVVTGKSWMWSNGNPAALIYAMRSTTANLPVDDNVVYAKHSGLGHIIHISELEPANE